MPERDERANQTDLRCAAWYLVAAEGNAGEGS